MAFTEPEVYKEDEVFDESSDEEGDPKIVNLIKRNTCPRWGSQNKKSECPKTEAKSKVKPEGATGQDDWNLDSVLKELGEGGEGNEKKGKAKKSKTKKGKKNNMRHNDSISKHAKHAKADSMKETKDTSEHSDLEKKIEEVDSKCVEKAATTEEVASQNEAGSDQEKELRLDNDLVSFPDPHAFGSELVNREAKLHDLLESHIHLVESKGAEMSQIISKLDDAEEEKSALEKETEKLDAAANELQEKREQLEFRKLSNAKNLRKFGEKKEKLEEYLDRVTSDHQIAKEQLDRDIEELKMYIDSNKIEVLKVEKSLDWKNEWLESIESKIAAKEKELECPVCLEVGPLMILLG